MYESRNVPESEVQIDATKYSKGVYYVTAKIGDKIEKQSVVVE